LGLSLGINAASFANSSSQVSAPHGQPQDWYRSSARSFIPDADTRTVPRTGVHGALKLIVPLREYLWLEPQIAVSLAGVQQRWESDTLLYRRIVRCNYLQFPLCVTLRLPLHGALTPFLSVGAVGALRLSARDEIVLKPSYTAVVQSDSSVVRAHNTRWYDAGVSGSTGIDIFYGYQHIRVALRFFHGVVPITYNGTLHNSRLGRSGYVYNRSIGVVLGLIFGER
jgi:hypothetical protein